MEIQNKISSKFNDLNEGVANKLHDHWGYLTLAVISGLTLAMALYNPLPFVNVACAIFTLCVCLLLVVEGRFQRQTEDRLAEYWAQVRDDSISDQHGNIVEDPAYSPIAMLDDRDFRPFPKEPADPEEDGNPFDDQFPLPPRSKK